MIGIYKITNQINGKCYIGQSVNITDRWRHHRNAAQTEDTPLYKAIRKYGLENFSFEVIEECSKKQLNEREIYWIDFYNSYNRGYNQTKGGEGGQGCPVKISEDQLQQILQLLKENILPQKEIASLFNVGEDTISEINWGKTRFQDNINYPLRKRVLYEEEKRCPICNTIIHRQSTYCKECKSKLSRKVERPSREELKQLIRIMPFTQISKRYDVSDNAIRKWCDGYGLPRRVKDIKQYTDEEWESI